MSPDQFQLNDIISFSIIPEYDENNHSNFSLSYYNLFFDECENVEENSAFNVSRLMTTLVGRKRLTFITVKSLKMIFSSALKNLNKIFKTENHKEEFYSQLVKYCDEKIQLVSSFLIEKIYDTSQEMLLTNPFLVDYFIDYISIDDYRKYYPVDDEDAFHFKNRSKRYKIDSHEYLVKFSTKRLEILYKELLKIPKMDMIFIKKPSSYHIHGNNELMTQLSNYQKSFAPNAFSDFIMKPHNIDWIFVFFSIDHDVSSFFTGTNFKETEDELSQKYQVRDESCFFVVFNDIVLCDMYRIHLSNLQFSEASVSDECHHSLLFSYRAS